jgi:hypothetical protein
LSFEPLQRSGLVFTGANQNFTDSATVSIANPADDA